MKKTVILLAMALVASSASADINDILKGLGSQLGGSGSSTTETTTDNNSNQSSGGLLENIASIGNALGIIPSQKVDINYLMGTWKYSKPAVAFQSDNLLKKAGGTAASMKIESELSTYYKRFGIDKLVLVVEKDNTFTMKVGKASLSGTVESSEQDGTITFNFNLFKGKMPMGKVTAYVNAETSSTMALTFDISKLIDIVSKVSSFSGNSTLKTFSSLLSSYDGLTAGFRMTKQR